MPFYKVVRKEGDLRKSVVAVGFAEVVYEPGRPARPVMELLRLGYGLFVFDNRYSAEEFAITCGDEMELWSCRVGSAIRLPPQFLTDRHMLRPDVFKKAVESCDVRGNEDWPDGSLTVDEVTLLERVA